MNGYKTDESLRYVVTLRAVMEQVIFRQFNRFSLKIDLEVK